MRKRAKIGVFLKNPVSRTVCWYLAIALATVFPFTMGCATKGTLDVREVRPHIQSDSLHQLNENESLVFGRILATFNEKNINTRYGGVIVTDLSGEQFSRRLQFSPYSNNKYFFWALPQGFYRIISVSVPSTRSFIEPTPFIFDVPDDRKAYYLGDLILDLTGERSFFKYNRLEEISKFDVVDNYVEATDFLISKNPTFEDRIEKLLMKKDDQNGLYDTKIINDSESKYYSMKTSSETTDDVAGLMNILIPFGILLGYIIPIN